MTGLTYSMAALRSAVVATSPGVLGLMVAACATVNTPAPVDRAQATTDTDFRHHVEEVFRFQNQVASDLITRFELSDDPEMQPSDELLAAEDRMQESCRYLNKVVTMSIDGKEPDLSLKINLMKTLDSCDVAAHNVASLFHGGGQAVVMKVGSPL